MREVSTPTDWVAEEGGIRTLDRVLAYTPLAGARFQPAQPPLRGTPESTEMGPSCDPFGPAAAGTGLPGTDSQRTGSALNALGTGDGAPAGPERGEYAPIDT